MKIIIEKTLKTAFSTGLLLSLLSVKIFAGEIDTTKVIFILDNKRVPANSIINGLKKGNIQFITKSTSTKDALRIFGEKYRYGIHVYKTR